jgi:hypothetical protein
MRTPRLYYFLTAALAFGLSNLAITPSALAQAEDQAASRALFDEGRRFADSGKYDHGYSRDCEGPKAE